MNKKYFHYDNIQALSIDERKQIISYIRFQGIAVIPDIEDLFVQGGPYDYYITRNIMWITIPIKLETEIVTLEEMKKCSS